MGPFVLPYYDIITSFENVLFPTLTQNNWADLKQDQTGIFMSFIKLCLVPIFYVNVELLIQQYKLLALNTVQGENEVSVSEKNQQAALKPSTLKRPAWLKHLEQGNILG